ncbi:MAG: amidohydrolase family protein, partial [Candidatus Heimdallarchaeaceae archaeon]
MVSKIPIRKIFYNGTILTMEEKQPGVEAVGIEGEKIVAAGLLDEVITVLGNEYDLIDLKGNTLLPGFIDSHMHPMSFVYVLMNLDLSPLTSLKELQDFLKKTAEKRGKGELIFGFKLKEEMFEIPKLPTRWDLDVACPENPVIILRYDGHIGVVNSKTLELVGITPDTKVPKGGEIRKNEK